MTSLWPAVCAGFVFAVLSLAAAPSFSQGARQIASSPIEARATDTMDVDIPSLYHTGDPHVDTIRFRYYPSRDSSGELRANAPGAVLIPPTGSDERDPLMRRIAHYLTTRGIHCAVISLPYHGKRSKDGEDIVAHFASPNAALVAAALQQSGMDVSSVAGWLAARPEIDSKRIGVVGISLGAIVAHIAMGRDSRIGCGVALLGAGDLPDFGKHSIVAQVESAMHPYRNGPAEMAALRRVDPLASAGNNRPRHVLMIEAARDIAVPPRDAETLWRALGEPPIQWVDTNHLALGIAPQYAMATICAYLWSNWNPPSASDPPVPHVWAPTIKIGALVIRNSRACTALQYQALALGHTREHTSLLHVDLGVTPSRAFAAAGITLNSFVDAGFLVRTGDRKAQPYVSVHIAL